MFFRISNNNFNQSNSLKINEAKFIAYKRILRYPLKSQGLALDNYFREKYKKGLKQVCRELLLLHTWINTGAEDDTLIVSFKDKQSDNLASLITYGNSEIKGCGILKYAFDQK